MFASSELLSVLTIIFGGLGGLSAFILAINTIQARREANRQKTAEEDNASRMTTFETSQSSLQAALARADAENAALRDRLSKQEGRISDQDLELIKLKTEVAKLRSEMEVLKGDKP